MSEQGRSGAAGNGGGAPKKAGRSGTRLTLTRRSSGPATQETSGVGARDLALTMLSDVLDRGRTLDDAVASALASSKGLTLDTRDRGLARLIATTVLRRKSAIEAIFQIFMEKPLPPRLEDARRIMLVAAAQILYLETPAHAAVSIAVAQTRSHHAIQHLSKLVNAVLRRVSLEGRALLPDVGDPITAFPAWLREGLEQTYGTGKARDIAEASLTEAPLDLTIKNAGVLAQWADRLGGIVLSTGSVRLASGGRIEDRKGYADGAWWVQDAAAALPARLLGDDLTGQAIVDLCAAPGGKTAQLAARGADVTAVDISGHRLKRVAENLGRLGLTANLVEADAASWQPGRIFDAVLLDAPCSASGTIRRHPDILHLKRDKDVAELVRLQTKLLSHAADLVRPGGTLIYCTCSMLRAEGESRIQGFLDRHPGFARAPISPGETGTSPAWLTPEGALRTLPTDTPDGDPEKRGMDGFYIARLVRRQ